MQAVILAGGNGTRLHPLNTPTPKPLMPFFDRPVVEHMVKLLAKSGIDDIIITTSHIATDIPRYFGDGSRWNVSIRYSIENHPAGSAGAVRLVREMITDTFLVVSGDVITDFDLAAAVEAHSTASPIASILLCKATEVAQFGIVDRDNTGRVTRFIEKPNAAEAFGDTIDTGIYVLEPEVLSSISDNSAQDFANDLIPLLLRNQESVYGFDVSGYWCDVGDVLQYRNAHFDALQGKLKVDLPAVHAGEGIWVGEGVDIHPSAQLSSPIFIGSGASVGRNAVVGEHTVIGANAIVEEGARISRSVIGSGAFVGQEITLADCLVSGGYSVTDPVRLPQADHVRPKRAASRSPRFAQEAIV